MHSLWNMTPPELEILNPSGTLQRTKLLSWELSLKSPELESPDDLCTRIDEATKFIDLEQLALSPQCGFASTVAGNPVTFDDEKRKLARIVEVSERVWG